MVLFLLRSHDFRHPPPTPKPVHLASLLDLGKRQEHRSKATVPTLRIPNPSADPLMSLWSVAQSKLPSAPRGDNRAAASPAILPAHTPALLRFLSHRTITRLCTETRTSESITPVTIIQWLPVELTRAKLMSGLSGSQRFGHLQTGGPPASLCLSAPLLRAPSPQTRDHRSLPEPSALTVPSGPERSR